MSVDDYIRMRRLALASVQLIHSDERIINIALYAQFNSHEAFSRSFKKLYGLSPGEFRKTMRIITFKEGEKSQMESPIKGWFLSGSHPYHYKMDVDHKVVHEGRVSGYLKSETVLEEDEFATMMQQFKSDNYKGKRIKLSCFVKCDNVARFAGAWMRVDNQSGDVLQFDNMSNRPIVGTLDWNYYSIILDIPKESASISFGMLLQGVGEIWMDKYSFEEVDESVQTTNIEFFPEMLDEPVNLSFEEF